VRLAADITPLRNSRGFRWLYVGQVANMVGTQVAQVAVSLQVYALTRSSLAVGFVGLAALAPLIVFGLYGGSIADAIDRRLLILLTSTGSTVTVALLLAQAVAGLDQVWLLYVCVAVLSAFFAVDNPTRRAAVPRLVGLPAVPAANTLLVTAYNLGIIGGPLVAGTLVGASGYISVYALDTAAFVITVCAISQLPPIPPVGGGRRAGLSAVLEGLRYLRSRQVLLMAFAVDINAMVFGMPRALFPALAAGQFHGGAQVAGYLYAAPAVGALMVTVLGGWLPGVRRLGLAVLLAVVVWGAAIAAFGLVRALWPALILLAVAGAADSVSAVFRASILQLTTPDAMRGRMSGVYTIVVAGGPRLGDLEAGAVATAFTPAVSVVSGGLACLAGVALLALAVPGFARYHVPQSPQESPAPALLPVCN
jgi:MFS family permease